MEPAFGRARLRISTCIVVCVGLIQSLGILLSIPFLGVFGAMTAASPAPQVFSTFRGSEIFSWDYELEFRSHDRTLLFTQYTPEVLDAIQAPFAVKGVIGLAFMVAPLSKSIREEAILNAILKKALCDEWKMGEFLGVHERPTEVILRARARVLPEGQRWSRDLKC